MRAATGLLRSSCFKGNRILSLHPSRGKMFPSIESTQMNYFSMKKFTTSSFYLKSESKSISRGNNISHPKDDIKSISNGTGFPLQKRNKSKSVFNGNNISHPKNESISGNGLPTYPKNESISGNDLPPGPNSQSKSISNGIDAPPHPKNESESIPNGEDFPNKESNGNDRIVTKMYIWINVKLRELEELDNQLGEEYAKINSKTILFFIGGWIIALYKLSQKAEKEKERKKQKAETDKKTANQQILTRVIMIQHDSEALTKLNQKCEIALESQLDADDANNSLVCQSPDDLWHLYIKTKQDLMMDIFENEEMKYVEAHGERKLDLFQMVEVSGLGIAELDRQKSAAIRKLGDVPTWSPEPQPDKALMFFVNATGDYVEIHPNYIWEWE